MRAPTLAQMLLSSGTFHGLLQQSWCPNSSNEIKWMCSTPSHTEGNRTRDFSGGGDLLHLYNYMFASKV